MSMPPYAPAPGPRRRKVWPWIVLALVVGGCLGGGALLLGGTAAVVNEGVKAVESAEATRKGDVKINGCKLDDALDLVTVTYTIVSTSTGRETYLPQFEVVAPNGDVIGNVGDITGEVPPGGTYKGKAVGSINEDAAKFTCRLASA